MPANERAEKRTTKVQVLNNIIHYYRKENNLKKLLLTQYKIILNQSRQETPTQNN